MNSASAVVAADAVGMTFPGGVQALGDINFTFCQGEFVSLVGPSGCGKSTLLRLIAGLAKPSQGELTVAGQSPEQARRRKAMLSFVFQDATLLPWRSAADNVRLPLELAGVARGEQERRIGEGLSMVGLSDFALAHPRQLSGGQEQRVGIARAIVANPAVIVADEPTGGLDAVTSEQIQVLMKRLNQELGMTMLMVTHDPTVAAIGSRRLSLDQGQIVSAPPAADDLPRRRLSTAG